MAKGNTRIKIGTIVDEVTREKLLAALDLADKLTEGASPEAKQLEKVLGATSDPVVIKACEDRLVTLSEGTQMDQEEVLETIQAIGWGVSQVIQKGLRKNVTDQVYQLVDKPAKEAAKDEALKAAE